MFRQSRTVRCGVLQSDDLVRIVKGVTRAKVLSYLLMKSLQCVMFYVAEPHRAPHLVCVCFRVICVCVRVVTQDVPAR